MVSRILLWQTETMDALSLPLANRFFVVVAPHAATPQLFELSARLSTAGPLRVLDGGNRYNIYPVAAALRRQTADLHAALERITLARAFTCYQMLALLAQTPMQPIPTLLVDMLATFYDENVTLEESQRLLEACLPHLQRLSTVAPLVVSLKPPHSLASERNVLVDTLCRSADQCWSLETLPAPNLQPSLW